MKRSESRRRIIKIRNQKTPPGCFRKKVALLCAKGTSLARQLPRLDNLSETRIVGRDGQHYIVHELKKKGIGAETESAEMKGCSKGKKNTPVAGGIVPQKLWLCFAKLALQNAQDANRLGIRMKKGGGRRKKICVSFVALIWWQSRAGEVGSCVEFISWDGCLKR